VFVLINNGNGTFAADVTYPLDIDLNWIEAADFDNDGEVDIAVSPYAGTQFEILMNHGDGTLAPPITFPNQRSNKLMVAADMNADGRIDMVTQFSNDNPPNASHLVSVMLNTCYP
jgi:hypothetical protein